MENKNNAKILVVEAYIEKFAGHCKNCPLKARCEAATEAGEESTCQEFLRKNITD